jgi:hypothetical protein
VSRELKDCVPYKLEKAKRSENLQVCFYTTFWVVPVVSVIVVE